MHSYVTCILPYLVACTRVNRLYSYVTRMLLVSTRMLPYILVCYLYELVCTRMYSYVTRVLLVCSFSHDHIENHGNALTRESKFYISLRSLCGELFSMLTFRTSAVSQFSQSLQKLKSTQKSSPWIRGKHEEII